MRAEAPISIHQTIFSNPRLLRRTALFMGFSVVGIIAILDRNKGENPTPSTVLLMPPNATAQQLFDLYVQLGQYLKQPNAGGISIMDSLREYGATGAYPHIKLEMQKGIVAGEEPIRGNRLPWFQPNTEAGHTLKKGQKVMWRFEVVVVKNDGSHDTLIAEPNTEDSHQTWRFYEKAQRYPDGTESHAIKPLA